MTPDQQAAKQKAATETKMTNIRIRFDEAGWTNIEVSNLGALVIISATDPQGRARSGARDDGDTLADDLLSLGVPDPPRKQPAPEPVPDPVQADAEIPSPEPAEVQPLEYPDEPDPLSEALNAERARADRLQAELDALKAREPSPTPLPPHDELATTKLVGWGAPPDPEVTSDDLLEFMQKDTGDFEATRDLIAKLSGDKRRRFTELLNVELAELQQKRGAAGEDLKREADIEQLLGLFARVGEM